MTFDQKINVLDSFPELKKTQRSNGRFSYVYPASKKRGKVVVTELHPSGNGYVCAKYMEKERYVIDKRGWVNIKDFTESELVEIVEKCIRSMLS